MTDKKWCENQQAATGPTARPPTPPPATTSADTVPILDGRDHTYIRKTAKSSNVNNNSTVSPSTPSSTALTSTVWASTAPKPTTRLVRTVLRPSTAPGTGNIRQISAALVQLNQVEPASNQPAIRVKPIGNLTNANQMPASLDTHPKPQAFAKKSVSIRSIVRTSDGTFRLKMPNDGIQKQQQQLRQPNQTIGISSASASNASTSVTTASQLNPVKQPVKLWNNMMMTKATAEPLKVHVSVKMRTEDNETRFPMHQRQQQQSQPQPLHENPIENGALDGASVLKIGQVFEGVNENFADDIFNESNIEPTPQYPNQTTGSLLEALAREVDHNNQSNNNINGKAATAAPQPQPQKVLTQRRIVITDEDDDSPVTIIQNDDKNCSDYRCNMCLTFNDSLDTYRDHMWLKHEVNLICERCHGAFSHELAFQNHLETSANGSIECPLSSNAARTYICIVEPPIILMRNEKVFAFRCKNCDLAFQNQRNYVQHAQRHAKLFRCKLCPTKPLNIDLMSKHLTHHKI